MKNSFKKIALLCVGLMTTASSFALSTGAAVGVGLGSAAAVTLLAVGIHKARKRHREQDENYKSSNKKMNSAKHKKFSQSPKETKKDLKKQLADNCKEQKEHKKALHKLKKSGKGSTAEAEAHSSMLKSLESTKHDLETRLKEVERKIRKNL